jgi:hypothetical protein
MKRILIALLVFAVAGEGAFAEKGPGRSLEQQLMEDLETRPLDADAQRDLRDPQSKTPSKANPAGGAAPTENKKDESLDSKLRRELGAAAVSEDANPILGIVEKMQQAQGLLGQSETGEKTQKLQAGILANLDELLKTARSRSQSGSCSQQQSQNTSSRRTPSQASSKPGGQGKPTGKPAKNGATQAGKSPPAPRLDMNQMKEVLKSVWGELPQHEREQMLELPIEEFLPKYEVLIEAYFKRLAEEQGGGRRGEK